MSHGTGRLTGVISAAVSAIIFAITGAAFLAVPAVPAAAQSYLRASSPGDGSKVGVAPSQAVLEFNQPIRATGYRVAVFGPGTGVAYQQLAARISGERLTQPLRPLGPPGVYRVEYRVVSAAGLPLTGEVRFTLTRPGPADGGAAARNVPLVSGLTTTTDTRPWEVWTAGTLAVLLVIGAVLFGRRVTHDID